MSTHDRLHALDAVRAFALLLGVAFHAGFSFLPGLIPGIWAMTDNSPSTTLSVLMFTSHIFRMSLFFFVAGFFARLLFVRKGARGFWANRAKRIIVPLVAGWLVLFPLIAGIWIWGIVKTFGGNLPAPPANMPPAPPGAFPLTHLWFLYYLVILYAGLLVARTAIVRLDRSGALRRAVDAMVQRATSTGVAAAVLPIPLIVALYLRADWVAWFGIPTPDSSLIPQVASLVGYGTAIAFGWIVHRQLAIFEVWGRQWPLHIGGAVVATVVCLSIAGVTPAFVPMPRSPQKAVYAASFGIAIWCWSLALIGLAVRFLSQPRPAVRYLADASYWIYLVHLPVVAVLQVLVGRLPLHWTIKFPLILVVSLAFLLVTYRYLVRPTFIGKLLNGRKYPRGGVTHISGDGGPDSGPVPSPTAVPEGQSVASLEAVTKRYGKTTALDTVDLDVRQGELLALLGPNGAGKTTAISLWLGLLQEDAGRVRLLGRSPLDVEARRHVGVMMQDAGLPPELRVRELIELTAGYYPEPLSTPDTLMLTRLDGLADRSYGKLSGGQKRQVQFALAVCGRPALLFLDEPTVGLDVEARENMWRTIRELIARGCSIVLTTHYLEEAEALADRVAVLASGRLVACGSVDDVRSIVSRRQITCSSVLSEDVVGAWPGVLSVSRSGKRLHVTVTDAEDVVRRLLAEDTRVRDLEVRQAGLAEAFSELTKEAA